MKLNIQKIIELNPPDFKSSDLTCMKKIHPKYFQEATKKQKMNKNEKNPVAMAKKPINKI